LSHFIGDEIRFEIKKPSFSYIDKEVSLGASAHARFNLNEQKILVPTSIYQLIREILLKNPGCFEENKEIVCDFSQYESIERLISSSKCRTIS